MTDVCACQTCGQPVRASEDVTVTPRDPAPVRFWAKVARRGPDECWPWLGAKAPRGYGRFYVGPRTVPAHRYAWELANGPMDSVLFACHHCDNPPCCNPAHLFAGTQSENMRDSVAKGRTRPFPKGFRIGEANLSHRLTEADVRAIRQSSASQNALARQFGVHRRTIQDVLSRKWWSHVA